MQYKGELIVEDVDAEKLYSVFLPELENGLKDRSEFSVEKHGHKLKILIQAKDSVALRATLNTITKLLTIYEKT
jgi:tRNA threonylcarbamoyladenosine modification (KEOPS) complex  Pcc1 subunit